MEKPNNKPDKRQRKLFNPRTTLVIVLMIGYIVSAFITLYRDSDKTVGTLSYDSLMEYIDEGKVESVTVTKQSNSMLVTMKDGTSFDAINPNSDTFVEDLWKRGAPITLQKRTRLDAVVELLGTLPFMILMTVLVVYIMGTMVAGNTKQFTMLKAKHNHTSFNDIKGMSETKREVQFIIEQMNNWEKLGELGARSCKGALLYGPPGNGKTMLAKAIAHESNVNFISCSGADFNEVFVGVGAARVRQLWELAMNNLPCIIFIDEIDCLGKRRRGGDAATNELNQTLNCLLQRMDGVNHINGLMVIGATNRKEDLDGALLRPGRFDRHFYIGAADNKKDRDEIVSMYLSNKKLSDDVTLDKASKLLVGLTGAEIENALNEAVYSSLQSGGNGIIRLCDIDEAVMKHYTSGVKREHLSNHDRNIVAIHEAGHTAVSLLLGLEIAKVSIIPYSSGLGGITIRDMDAYDGIRLKTKTDYEKDIQVMLAGKIAEEILCSEHTQGCTNDIEKASQMVYEMVTEFGMDKDMLLNERVLIENGLKHSLESDMIAKCNHILKSLNDRTETLLRNHKSVLENISGELLRNTTLVSPTLDDFTVGGYAE